MRSLPIDVRRSPRAMSRCLVAAFSVLLAACVSPPPLPAPKPLAPAGPVGLALCPTTVTPVELSTDTPEPDIPLRINGTPADGDDAIVATPDGGWAFAVTSDPAARRNVVVPIDLVTQVAQRPITIPGTGDTRAIAVSPDGTKVFASSGNLVVAVDVATRSLSPAEPPLTLPILGAIQGLAVDPAGTTLYALTSTAVYPVSIARWALGAAITTGLTSASVDSPHGIGVSPDGSTVYVLGTGSDGGGQMARIDAATGTLLPAVDFVKYGETQPTALAVAPSGQEVFVSDYANEWVYPVPAASDVSAAPIGFPAAGLAGGLAPNQERATDIAMDPKGLAFYVVVGFDAVLPFAVFLQHYEAPIPVCQGATSLAVAEVP